MTKAEAEALKPGDKVQCVDIGACALEGATELFEWKVETVFSAPSLVATRVLMSDGDNRQCVCHNNIAGKVAA